MSFQQEAEGSLGRGDQPSMGPNPPFPQTSQPQYPPPNFNYNSEYPSLDHELTMADHFQQPVPQAIASQLQEAATEAPQRNGDVNALSVNTNGSVSTGMAPPQTPHQSAFSPTGPRASMDETPDSATPGEDSNKRKRSKVSRACDECRRKKIRCDSGDTNDNSIKPCTNCTKNGMLCEFSRVPMKRGPSKGYIKELSERVQQVESLQAAMQGQPGYRQSLDGASITDPLYSPDDPISARRGMSFSSNDRNPFASTDYQRERMPSAGGAWAIDLPNASALKSRDRASFALAPDQRLPAPATQQTSTFWSESDELAQPPPKRQKMVPSSFKMDRAHLDNYYEGIHPEFPLLPPDVCDAADCVGRAHGGAVKALATVIGLFPSSRSSLQNGHNSFIFGESDLFSTSAELASFLKEIILEHPKERGVYDNVVHLWVFVLLALHREYDIKTIKTEVEEENSSFISRDNLLKASMDLSQYLLGVVKNDPDPVLRSAVQQARTLANVMMRFNWFASGATNSWACPEFRREDFNAFPYNVNTTFLVRAVRSFTTFQHLIRTIKTDDEFGVVAKEHTLSLHLSDALSFPGVPDDFNEDTLIVRQVMEFITLILSGYGYQPLPALVPTSHACRLASILTGATPTPNNSFRYNMIDYHCFALAVITLLDLVTKVPETRVCEYAEEALNKLQVLIKQRQQQYEDAIKVREEAGCRYDGFFGKDKDGSDVKNQTWMACLLTMIDRVPKGKWAITKQQHQPFGGPAGQQYTTDFEDIIRTGYGKILAVYAQK